MENNIENDTRGRECNGIGDRTENNTEENIENNEDNKAICYWNDLERSDELESE